LICEALTPCAISTVSTRDALRRFFKVDRDESGNQPPLPGIYPDKFARDPFRGSQPCRPLG
jgi:hypothetical protein